MSFLLQPWCAAALAAVLLIGAPSAHAQTNSSADEESRVPTGAAERAFQTGDYERARKESMRHDDADSLLIRAKMAEFDNDLELASRYASAALDRTSKPAPEARAAAAVGRLLEQRGQWTQAESHLRDYLTDHPKAHPVRLQLGLLLLDRGARAEAEQILDQFSRLYNNGHLEGAREFAMLGRAMQALGSFDDAHFAFEKMHKEDAGYVDGLVDWAELLLSKYNNADAARTLQEALEVNENHPDALVAMARLEMETKNYFDDARGYLDRAAEVAPGHPGMLITRAELAIYDSQCPEATRIAESIHEKRPRHLDAFIIEAACRYLADDREGFEAVRDEALAIKPDFARLYTETARYAQLVHRYVEVIELNERALELREGYAPALLGLGIGLSRVGREDEAVRYLAQAFNADPYNVRAYNMVELYEKIMPDYDFRTYEKFKLRTHRDQTEPLNRVLPPLIKEAMAHFEQKYDFEAADGLAVEIYPKGSTFGVRSVGLPHISPHGLCFGPTVIVRSPSDANFNWRQVVWHELAHVYHIQKAGYRVPRWFTEGLAEYETNVEDPAWVRHHDREIVAALVSGEVPSVTELDKHFTQARSYKGILRAYHLSSLVIHFIVDEYGFEAINDMLETFPEKLDTAEVINEALGEEIESFDEKFVAWLEKRYSNFLNQFVVSVDAIASEYELENKLADSPRDAVLNAKLAVARLRSGKQEQAEEAIEKALRLDRDDPTVRYLACFVALNQGRARDAYKHGTAVLDQFRDGYELRVALGHTAMLLEEPESARVHLRAATVLYEDGAEAWSLLHKVSRVLDDQKLEERAERRLFELDQNDPNVARTRHEWAVEQGRRAEALEAAHRWVSIDPLDVRAQRAVARASLALDQPDLAAQAHEVLVELQPDQRVDALLQAVSELSEAGFKERAGTFAERALEAGADQARVDRALGR